jgi:hypothetical protein
LLAAGGRFKIDPIDVSSLDRHVRSCRGRR